MDERHQARHPWLEVDFRNNADAASNLIQLKLIICYAIPRISMDESNLVISNINTADGGNYACLVESELEQKSASARLMVMGMFPLEIIHISAPIWHVKWLYVCV